MKKLLLIVAISLGFMACKKDDVNPKSTFKFEVLEGVVNLSFYKDGSKFSINIEPGFKPVLPDGIKKEEIEFNCKSSCVYILDRDTITYTSYGEF